MNSDEAVQRDRPANGMTRLAPVPMLCRSVADPFGVQFCASAVFLFAQYEIRASNDGVFDNANNKKDSGA